MRLHNILTCGVVLAATGVALGAGRPPGRGPKTVAKANKMFKQVDTNRDGKIEFKEAREREQFNRETFDKLDTNGDHALSKSELEAAANAHPDRTMKEWNRILTQAHADRNMLIPREQQEVFNRFDVNHDGKIDRSEALKAGVSSATFDRLDANDDGVIRSDEFMNGLSKASEKNAREVDRQIAQRLGVLNGDRHITDLGHRAFRSLDVNRDGKLTLSEIESRVPAVHSSGRIDAGAFFATADADKSGSLDAKEFRTFQDEVRTWLQGGEGRVRDRVSERAEKSLENRDARMTSEPK